MIFCQAVALAVFFWAALLSTNTEVWASDQVREWEYAATLEQNVATGRIVWLQDEWQRFLALFNEAEKTDNSRAVILLHDYGEYPDQRPLVHGLLAQLPQHGWAALAIQLPLREEGAAAAEYYGLFDEGRKRIDVAVDFVRQQGAQEIVLVGYGTGAAMAAYALSQQPNAISAFVAVSLPLPNSSLPQAQVGAFMKKIALPFLDVYAEADLPEVVDTARKRRMLAKDNPVYRQIKMLGENHAYRNDPGLVVKRIYSWLAALD